MGDEDGLVGVAADLYVLGLAGLGEVPLDEVVERPADGLRVGGLEFHAFRPDLVAHLVTHRLARFLVELAEFVVFVKVSSDCPGCDPDGVGCVLVRVPLGDQRAVRGAPAFGELFAGRHQGRRRPQPGQRVYVESSTRPPPGSMSQACTHLTKRLPLTMRLTLALPPMFNRRPAPS